MFVSVEEVQQLTNGYQVSAENIAAAQAIIEVYVGRTEYDVDNPRDYAMLGRAVAFQTVYMLNHTNIVFEQFQVRTMTVGGTSYTFPESNSTSPYIAPLAVMACKKLSWMRSRGVKTGTIGLPKGRLLSWWTT